MFTGSSDCRLLSIFILLNLIFFSFFICRHSTNDILFASYFCFRCFECVCFSKAFFFICVATSKFIRLILTLLYSLIRCSLVIPPVLLLLSLPFFVLVADAWYDDPVNACTIRSTNSNCGRTLCLRHLSQTVFSLCLVCVQTRYRFNNFSLA